MITRTIFSGYGGQGVLLMGYVLSYGAMAKGLNLTFMPAYGSEVRGGTANCTVIVSDKPVVAPVTATPDVLVAMNPPSVDRFGAAVVPGGLVLLNSSLTRKGTGRADLTEIPVPLVELARQAGSELTANMVMVGALCARTGLLNPDEAAKGLKDALKGKDKFLGVNRKGLELGFEYVAKAKF